MRRIIAVITAPIWIVALVLGVTQPAWYFIVIGAAGLCNVALTFRNR